MQKDDQIMFEYILEGFCAGQFDFFFVCVEFLRPSQQLRSCRAGQLPINTVPGRQVKTY